jgi:hypothetical protein
VNFWRSKGLTVKMKKVFYIATIINFLLWGCKSLTIRKEYLRRLEVFHHSAIRYIFNISKWQQATTRLSNKGLRSKFDFILNMQETIDERRPVAKSGIQMKDGLPRRKESLQARTSNHPSAGR